MNDKTENHADIKQPYEAPELLSLDLDQTESGLLSNATQENDSYHLGS